MPNKVGKRKANRNVKIFNDYRYFISTSREACRCYFLIEIAKFFDVDNRTISLHSILDFAEENISSLTKKDFLDYHGGKMFLPEQLDDYKQLRLSDIFKLRKAIEKKNPIISKFKGYRDQYLAHDDVNKYKYVINLVEIRQILNFIKKFIDVFYFYLDLSSNSYLNYIEEPKREIQNLVDCLRDHEDKYLKNIKYK